MEQSTGKEIEIKKIVMILKKRFWIVVLITILMTVLGILYNNLNKAVPIYESTARIIINDGKDLMATLKVVIEEPPVLEAVIKELQLERSVERLDQQINVESIGESHIVKITVLDSDPELATTIANTVAVVYKREVATLLNFENVEIFAEAELSENPQPINPPSNSIIKIAIVGGVAIGIGFVFLLDSLDNGLRTPRQIEKLLELPVLGSVSVMNKNTLEKNKGKKIKHALRGETIGS